MFQRALNQPSEEEEERVSYPIAITAEAVFAYCRDVSTSAETTQRRGGEKMSSKLYRYHSRSCACLRLDLLNKHLGKSSEEEEESESHLA